MIPKLLLALSAATLTQAAFSTPDLVNKKRQAASSSNACSAILSSANFTRSPSAVRGCLESVPLNADVQTNTIDYILGMTTLDVFEENHKSNIDPILSQNIDLKARLNELKTKVYTSDYAFQREVAELIHSLNDGHYYWTTCYDYFQTLHGLPLVALASEPTSTPSIYVAPDLPALASQYAKIDNSFYPNLDPARLAGARVTKIRGQPVLDSLAEFVNTTGIYQDVEQRWNALFASPIVLGGAWDHEPGSFTIQRGLEEDEIELSVVYNGTSEEVEITIPWRTIWVGEAPFTYASGEQFFFSECASLELQLQLGVTKNVTSGETSSPLPTRSNDRLVHPISPISFSSNRLNRLADTQRRPAIPDLRSFLSANNTGVQRELYSSCPINSSIATWPFASTALPTSDPAYLGGRDIQFYALDRVKTGGIPTGVIYVSTFSPDVVDDTTCFNRFVLDIVLGLQNFTTAGVERILVDTSNNGGGYVYLSGVLQLALAGGDYQPDLNFEILFRKSPMAQAAVDYYTRNPTEVDGYWNPAAYLAADAKPLKNTANYMDPGTTYTAPGGNVALEMSNRVQFAPENSYSQIEGVNPIAPFTSQEIVFTGNGLCGSACGGFTNFLAEYYNTTGYISSARPDNAITYTAFSSGNAVSSFYVDYDLTGLSIPVSQYRPDPLTTANYGFSLSGSLSPRSAPDQFLQYRPLTANGTFALTLETYSNPIAKWEYVANQVFKNTQEDAAKRPKPGNTGAGGNSTGVRTTSMFGLTGTLILGSVVVVIATIA